MKYFLTIFFASVIVSLYLSLAYKHISSFTYANNPGNPTIHMAFLIPSPASSSTKITYVALGDSLTAGVGAATEVESYPYRLAQLLAKNRNADVTLINLGRPGDTTIDVLNQQVPRVAEFHPDIVTLNIGVNDMNNRIPDETFKKNLASIFDGLSGTTKHFSVTTIPYLGNTSAYWPPYQIYFDTQTKHYNDLLRDTLIGRNINLIDLYSETHKQAFSDPDYYSPDGFHPSASAYDLWSKILYDHLNI